MKVKHFLNGLIYLDTINLEEKIGKSPNLSLTNDNLFFDLSKCQFAELGALAQLILIIESHLKVEHRIFIALPTLNLTTSQLKSQKDHTYSEIALAKQNDVNNFIKKTGFVNALQDLAERHNAEIYFTDEYDYVKKSEALNEEIFLDTFSVEYEEVIINEANYRFLLPFKIIDTEDDIQKITFDFEHQLDKILRNEERGIDNFDIRIIKNVILPELIKNVKYHSGESHAVFTIGLLNSNSIFFSNDYKYHLSKPGAKRKINSIELTHIKRIKENSIKSQVEIYFGDCGTGLLNNKFKKRIKEDFGNDIASNKKFLKLAFNRWSTIQDNDKRRGTKGLYRLKRIVDKYKGMVHIKTSNSNGGFFNGEFEFRPLATNFNGTLISVKTNSFKEINSFKISTDRKISNVEWTSEKVIIDKNLNCLEIIREKILTEKNLLLILDISEFDFTKDNILFESFLYSISEISHPSAIVLYLINNKEKLDDDSISTFVESVEERIKKVRKEIKEKNKDSLLPDSEDAELEEIHDPVLVIANSNQTFWYGGSDKLTNILNESYSNLLNEKSLKLRDLKYYQALNYDEQDVIKTYLETDHNLVTLNNDENIVFNFYGIERHYEDKVKNFKPEITDKLICTPKLNIVKSWIDIKQLLKDDEYGFALCLYLKYRRFYENKFEENISKIIKSKTFVLIDNNQQLDLTKKFVELIGLKNKNIRNIEEEIDYSMPKRIKLFNDNSNVIVLTTIVSSSETLRRMVKYAKRDNSNPELILCLINSRISKIEKLETWNELTDIVSVYQNNKIDTRAKVKDDKYFKNKLNELSLAELKMSPKYVEEKETDYHKLIKINKNLLTFLRNNKVLHYNHYGHYNKRHFTFYLDKNSIVNSIPKNDFLSKEFIGAFDEWKRNNDISEFTLYFNKKIVNNSYLLEIYLKSNEVNKFKFIDINEYELFDNNSIYFDFGILTGESINKLINKIGMVDNFLVCLLFNQSTNNNAEIYERIKTLRFKRNTSTKLFQNEEENFEEHIVKFKIKYLFNLPLSFFNSENCPICEHRRALDFYKNEDPYLKEFAEDRRERLKENSVDEIIELSYPVDFYYSDKENERAQELSKIIIFQMYELKLLLENASLYTKQRIKLYEYIHEIYSNIKNEILDPESKVYSLLYYLSHEINWLQREPLVFRDFRILLSKIAHIVAIKNIHTLIKQFDKKNNYDIPSQNLATRYKYSAISLLRSSDKLLFCQSIFDIISSSIINDKVGNNLLQNTIYHISSFFKNTYNKSEIYFIEIDKNLTKLLNEKTFSNEQHEAITFAIKRNKTMMKKSLNLGSEPVGFKEMKEKWESLYNIEMPKHPAPYQEWKGLTLKQHKETFVAIKEKPNLIQEKNALTNSVNELSQHCIALKSYILNNITPYLSNKLYLFEKSKFYRDQYSRQLTVTDLQNNFNRLDELIGLFKDDILEYLNYEEEYNNILNYFNECFIKKEKLAGSSSNSLFLNLINDFPSNISVVCNEVFTRNEFPKKKFSFNYRNKTLDKDLEWKAYFPTSLIKRHLQLIKTNILQKKNTGTELSDVELSLNISTSNDATIECEILYDSTEKWDKEPNLNGSLSTFEKHVNDFDGQLTYGLDDQGLYSIKLKLLRYE